MRPSSMLMVASIGLIVGCAPQQMASSPLPARAAHPPAKTAGPVFTTIYSFQGPPDGAFPMGNLHVDADGTLVGTTMEGGSTAQRWTRNNGTIFLVDPSTGADKVLYSFDGVGGAFPKTGMSLGTYGTTYQGGTGKRGTVFLIQPSGAPKVIHNFSGQPDGAQPVGKLSEHGKILYGTTRTGGSNFQGTVFSLTLKGKERILHNFMGYPYDGALPLAGVIGVNGTFYGTTSKGGTYNDGTVFEVTAGGTYKVLYNFAGAPDGAEPNGGVFWHQGALYGTTRLGGSAGAAGTAFVVHLDGTEKVLHSFVHADGTHPRAGLLWMNNAFYGTTASGGHRNGTIFRMTPNGRVYVLHAFQGSDGSQPVAALVESKGVLYGTTRIGGSDGVGTVFSVKP